MSKTRKDIIESAKKFIGTPYVWGGETEQEGGVDCSGLVYCIYIDAGFNILRYTAEGYRSLGKSISYVNALEGDLLFFGSTKATHIAIYAGNGQMYESIGNSKNTKSNKGKGVVLSKVSRRKDLLEVRTMFSEVGVISSTSSNKLASMNKGDEWVRRLQKAIGADIDGIAGSETLSKCPLLKIGMYKNEVVKLLQERLGNYFKIGVVGGYDGSFGKNTKNSVMELQKQKKLDIDGKCGYHTWKKLLNL